MSGAKIYQTSDDVLDAVFVDLCEHVLELFVWSLRPDGFAKSGCGRPARDLRGTPLPKRLVDAAR